MKKKKYQATKSDWAKGIILCILYLAFLFWVDAWWGIIVLPFIFDAYVTRLIPWTWWKEAENPLVRTICMDNEGAMWIADSKELVVLPKGQKEYEVVTYQNEYTLKPGYLSHYPFDGDRTVA